MECRPCSPDQRLAVMTRPSFSSGSEMRSAVCDGPNGMRSGPGLVPPGERRLRPQYPSSTKHDGRCWTSTGDKCHHSSNQASAEQGRRENDDGLMLTLPALLFQNGLPDLPRSLIEPHRNRAGVWRIKFCYEAGEPLSMDVVQATTMVSHLRELGEIELADEVTSAITSAKRYATM